MCVFTISEHKTTIITKTNTSRGFNTEIGYNCAVTSHIKQVYEETSMLWESKCYTNSARQTLYAVNIRNHTRIYDEKYSK